VDGKVQENEELTHSERERWQCIKRVIDNIPTEKTALFAFQLD
jgi:hypothetical protein